MLPKHWSVVYRLQSFCQLLNFICTLKNAVCTMHLYSMKIVSAVLYLSYFGGFCYPCLTYVQKRMTSQQALGGNWVKIENILFLLRMATRWEKNSTFYIAFLWLSSRQAHLSFVFLLLSCLRLLSSLGYYNSIWPLAIP